MLPTYFKTWKPENLQSRFEQRGCILMANALDRFIPTHIVRKLSMEKNTLQRILKTWRFKKKRINLNKYAQYDHRETRY